MKNMKILLISLLTLISLNSFSQTKEKQKEKYYQDIFADAIHGKKEIVLNDLARVDIVTDTFAIEVDFAHKWAESIGQSLYYGEKMNKQAGVLLIVDGTKENIYLDRLMIIAMKHNITVWIIDYNTDKWKKVIVERKYSY